MANQRKGDLLDGILFYQKQGEERDLPSVIYDYPETVIEKLSLFYKLWMLPSYAIPNKSIKGRYAQWIQELQELQAENDLNEVMKLASENYWAMNKRFIVSHPLAIKKLMIEADAEINHRNSLKKKVQPIEENKMVDEVASPTTVKSAIRDLKSLFDEE